MLWQLTGLACCYQPRSLGARSLCTTGTCTNICGLDRKGCQPLHHVLVHLWHRINWRASLAFAGWAVSEQTKKRGLLEDIRLNCEVIVTASFDNMRWLVRRVLLMPQPGSRSRSQARKAASEDDPLDLVSVSCLRLK